jgi:hypothetical protein
MECREATQQLGQVSVRPGENKHDETEENVEKDGSLLAKLAKMKQKGAELQVNNNLSWMFQYIYTNNFSYWERLHL